MAADTKSPLKDPPLRNPGESLDNEINDTFVDGVLCMATLATALWLVAGYEWFRSVTGAPPQPILMTALAVGATTFLFYRFTVVRQQTRLLKQGRDGEREVAQFLEDLRKNGAHVFHDVPGQAFNLDHIVIHASGVYVIETKTWSKPMRGSLKLYFDGAAIRRGNGSPDPAAVTQARAANKWLLALLEKSTTYKFPMRPVVVCPGWYMETTGSGRKSNVWVLNPKALQSFILHEGKKLADDQVGMAALHLDRYIRASRN